MQGKINHFFKIPVARTLVLLLLAACKGNQPMFKNMPASSTGITFSNTLPQKPLFNILYYLYYYNGGGVATGDINNDGLTDIYFTANSKGNNKLYLNKGNFEFEDITEKAGVKGQADWCSGVTMADINNDGLLDIYVSTVSGKYKLTGHNELYINNGNNTFTERSANYGLNTSCFTTQSVFFDYDRDGDLDCFILNQSHHPHANIVDTSFRNRYDSASGDRLYRNDIASTGRFTDVSKQAGIYQSNLGYGLGISVADFNNDGWDDMYIGNDFHENDYYYINQQNGTFIEEGAKHFGHYSRFSMGNDAADYDNDGQLDIVTVDMLPPDEKTLKTYGSDENPDIYTVKLTSKGYQHQSSKNALQHNNGNGSTYSETSLYSGVAATDWSWCPLFADFDNDGNKDLFISSGIVKRPVDLDYVKFVSNLKMKGMDRTDAYDTEAINAMPDGASHPFFYKGSGTMQFTDVSNTWGTAGMKGYYNGAAYADFDNDGKLDMVINVLNGKAVVLKNNQPAAKNFLTLQLKGDSLNPFAVGAKAYLFTKKGLQYQQLMPARGFQSSSELRLHFGLDTLTTADSLLLVWPNQAYQLIKNPAINQQLTINQRAASQRFNYNQFFSKPALPLQPAEAANTISWRHTENQFLDFNTQYLIPHQLSAMGPKIAVADINKDGLDDVYLCGAKGQPGSLQVQQPNGSFTAIDTALFKQFTVCEDVDALFLDANNDGYTDLWVVSGGNELPSNEIAYADRLFINNGKGHFSLSKGAFQNQFFNKSCIAAADIDKDGDTDVFIGHLSDQSKYGLPMSAYLYINNGKGQFSIAPNSQMNLLNTGMVTTACFADFNKDGWPDLAIAGEWMPLKIYLNNKGLFTQKITPASTGLWQKLYVADVNSDGYPDLLAGNWGLNNKLSSGKNGPVKLYVKDFDNNASIEQVICYTIDGKEYPFLAKDELERALPVLKKAYLTYSEVAGKTVQYMFYDLFTGYTEQKAEVLASSCFINNQQAGFSRVNLPEQLQLAPLFAFASLPGYGYMGAGNFYGTTPYEGRYDAQQPALIGFDKNKNSLTYKGQAAQLTGEVRDLKWINGPGATSRLLVARNNGNLQVLQVKQP
ncbi:MAG: hypothetical protein RL172_1348 [Bacteroidota bacterium]